MNTNTLALLDAYKAKRLDPTIGNPVAASEQVVDRFRRSVALDAAVAMAQDIRDNLSDYSDETGLPPGSLGRIANGLGSLTAWR